MPQRNPHADNALIDAMEEDAGGSTQQNTRAGGNLARDVGTRAEEKAIEGHLEGDEVDRVKGSDDSAADRLKGDKTIAAMPTSRG
jgi:hypothetical protein